MSQQLGNEASVSKDSDIDMDDVSEGGSTTGHLAEPSLQEATQSTQERTPETPRGGNSAFGSLCIPL